MKPALLMSGYALAVAWGAPAFRGRWPGAAPRPGLSLAAWLTAMAGAVAAVIAALWFLAGAAVAGWPGLAQAVGRSVAGQACAPPLYRSALFELALAIAAILAVTAAAVTAGRHGRGVRRAGRRARARGPGARPHAPGPPPRIPRLADGAGGACRPGGDVLDAPQPAPYGVPGRPGTIVVT